MGTKGEQRNLKMELLLLADVGMLGLPNAGKSTFIRAVSAARPKVADYPFTTLVPNLGVVRVGTQRSFVIADIPGLIEGASEGVGLGHEFLRHIERTKMLIHCISLESEDIARDYKTIRKELEAFDPSLITKKEILLLTKTDLIDEKTLKAKIKEAKKLNKDIYSVSVIDDVQTKTLKDDLVKMLRGI